MPASDKREAEFCVTPDEIVNIIRLRLNLSRGVSPLT